MARMKAMEIAAGAAIVTACWMGQPAPAAASPCHDGGPAGASTGPTTSSSTPSDAEIGAAIGLRLTADLGVQSEEIIVQVKNGVATLSGTAQHLPGKHRKPRKEPFA